MAICDYLGKKYGIAGKSLEDSALALMTALSAEDFRIKVFSEVVFGKDTEKFSTETLGRWLPNMERNLVNGRGTFVPNVFTYGDLCMFEALQSAIFGLKQDLANPAILEPYPALTQWYLSVASKEGVKEHLASRPDAPF